LGRDQIDIISVGDSFTHATCVDPDKNPTALIRNVYENTLNLGQPGGGQLIQLARIREYGGNLKPSVVLWFYFEGNDLSNLQKYLGYPHLRKYLETNYHQDLVSKQATIDRALKAKINRQIMSAGDWTQRKRAVVGAIVLRRFRHHLDIWIKTIKGCKPPDQTLVLFERVLRNGNEYVKSWGGDVFFVYLPAWERYRDGNEPCIVGEHDFKYRDKVLRIVRRVGLPIIDVKESFDAHPDPLSLFPFRLRGHYTEEGYRLVADTVLQSADLRNRLAEGR